MKKTVDTPIAIGELIDKITILEIKAARFSDAAKTKNVRAELLLLVERRDRDIAPSDALSQLAADLRVVNEKIWDLEEQIRDCERRDDFGPDFVNIARQIYKTNDKRAALKRQINLEFGSAIIEEKSYDTL